METKEFIKGAATHFKTLIRAANLLPRKQYYTWFEGDSQQFAEYLELETVWLGQKLKSKCFKLAPTAEREQFLQDLFQSGHITEDEYKRYLRRQETDSGDK